ncbi:hypothetical protein [Chroococcidiopsis sp.]|uniref:hypothetical protein n=1 Tax=Chroococcidiopsis sp. TaxID=3088168 RepID=UPI003F2F6F28
MARRNAHPGKKEDTASRRLQAMELRKAGKNYRAIGKELGISEAQAHRDVATVVKSITKLSTETALEHQALELERLEMAMAAIAPQVQKGYLQAIDRWLRLCESRRKLLGIDAPAKQEINSNTAISLSKHNYSNMDAEELSRLYMTKLQNASEN